jgi:hypothetical protein
VYDNQAAAVLWLVAEAKAAIDQELPGKLTPIIAIAREGLLSVVGILVNAGASCDQAGPNGLTALYMHMAAYKRHASIVENLIKAGADVDVTYNIGMTPLIVATFIGEKKIADLQLSVGHASVSIALPSGYTALVSACLHQHFDIAILLIVHGAESMAGRYEAGTPEYAVVPKGLLLRAQVPLWIGQRLEQVGRALPGDMPKVVCGLARVLPAWRA